MTKSTPSIWHLLKFSYFRNGFLRSSIFSEKQTNEFDFTAMIPQVDLFSFVFWRKLTTPKRHFEINRPSTKPVPFNSIIQASLLSDIFISPCDLTRLWYPKINKLHLDHFYFSSWAVKFGLRNPKPISAKWDCRLLGTIWYTFI